MDVRDLFGEIKREVRNATDYRMQYALSRACQIFCQKSWFLRRQFSFVCVGLPSPQTYYPVTPPENESIIAIKHAQLTQVTPGNSVVSLRFVYPTLVNPNIGPEQPTGIAFIPYKQVALFPAPDQAYPVLLEIITQNVLNSPYIPDEIGVEWAQAMGYGALEWLYKQKGNPWYDPALSKENQMLFYQQINAAKIKAAYDFTPNNRSWVSPGFMLRR